MPRGLIDCPDIAFDSWWRGVAWHGDLRPTTLTLCLLSHWELNAILILNRYFIMLSGHVSGIRNAASVCFHCWLMQRVFSIQNSRLEHDHLPLPDMRANCDLSPLCNGVFQKPRRTDQHSASCSSKSRHSSLDSSSTLIFSQRTRLIAASLSPFYLPRIIVRLVNLT